jgi:glycosyltransferase involved in cell wall biosynthesis
MDKTDQANTLVSIGVPVRNAVDWIPDALEQLLGQTHRNIEIILSDNNSTDGTDTICRSFAARDARIRYIRHDAPLGAIEHFRFVLDQAQADFFMWAAHDDRHSHDYVEKLLGALLSNSNASLAFGDTAIFHRPEAWRDAAKIAYNFECDGRNRFWRGLLFRDYIREGYLHIYGLIRCKALEGYRWPDIELGGDRPLLLHLWRRGKFVRAESACFYCYKPERKKTHEQRAKYISGRGVRLFPYTRLSWVCAQAACNAEALEGRVRNFSLVFGLLLCKEIRKKTVAALKKCVRPIYGIIKSRRI